MLRFLTLVGFIFAAFAAGCSAPSQPLPPADSASPGVDMSFFGPWRGPTADAGAAGFYPIAIGNTWSYQRNIAVSIRSGDDVSTTYMSGPTQRRQLCYEDRGQRRYVVEQYLDGAGFELAVTYVRVREDRNGLYEADVPVNEGGCFVLGGEPELQASGESPTALLARTLARESDPVRRAAFERAGRELLDRVGAARTSSFGGGLGAFGRFRSEELLRLRYPLFARQRWVVRASPRFTGVAEAFETVETGAGARQAWRIRTDSELFGPADRVYTWYGESGLVQMSLHVEYDATDIEGNPIGRLSWDELLRLEAIDLESE